MDGVDRLSPEPLLVPAARNPVRERSKEHWIVLALAWIALAGTFSAGAVLEPDPRGWGTHQQLGFRPCLPMVLWNVPCPGCGVTTAVALAVHGEARASLRAQPFGLVTLGVLAAFAVWSSAQHVRGRDVWLESKRIAWKRWGSLLGTAALVAWVYKIALVRGWLV
jgi:hypothetical protein